MIGIVIRNRGGIGAWAWQKVQAILWIIKHDPGP